jgi:glutamate dehydrogenase/leucine dehydrogenase
VAARLAEHGIGYVPDFIANAGGLIAVAEQLNGWSAERVRARVEGIRGIVRELIGEAWASGETTLATALRRARAGAVAA